QGSDRRGGNDNHRGSSNNNYSGSNNRNSGMDWLTEHHATIDCHSYRVIFGDIHAPEYTYHGAEPISKAPYRMDPVELKELKDQL
nr:putative reverse transcriptase domain-containing protein [Tanacetum cinerariifolium]